MDYGIYARGDDRGVVVKLFSDCFERPGGQDVLIERGQQEYHAHVHLMYALRDQDGRYNFKLAGGRMEQRSEQEKLSDRPAPQKSALEVLQETVDMLVLQMLEGGMPDV